MSRGLEHLRNMPPEIEAMKQELGLNHPIIGEEESIIPRKGPGRYSIPRSMDSARLQQKLDRLSLKERRRRRL